jgi:hypothetical protein
MDYQKYKNGCLPSPPDSRDFTIDKFKVASATQLPTEYIIPYVPDIYDQGTSSMCVAFALAGMKQSHEWKERGVKKRYSPAFIYSNREITDWQGEGMIPRQALKRLKYGTCEFNDFNTIGTYQTCKSIFNQKANQLVPLALPQKVYAYAKLKNTQEIKQCLFEFQMPVFISIDVYDSFYSTGSNGIVSPSSGNNNGGHGVLVVGWKCISNIEYLIILNSWSTSWAANGFCYLNPNTYPINEIWAVLDQNPQQEINKPTDILLTIGNKKMVVDSTIVEMDVAPFYHENRTFVPLRFISEALGYKVDWYDCGSPDGKGDMILVTNGGERTLDELKQIINKS